MTEAARVTDTQASCWISFILSVALILSLLPGSAQARSPMPYFQGVERIGLFCSRVLDPDVMVMAPLCDRLAEVIATRYSMEVAIGAEGMSDTGTLFLVINGHPQEEVEEPGHRALSTRPGPITVFTLRLFRSAHINPFLRDLAPYLHTGPIADADLEVLATILADRVSAILGLIASEK